MSANTTPEVIKQATPGRWLLIAERVSLAAFFASLLLGMLVPIYTDEIGWRMQLRAGIDGGVDRMVSDICGPRSTVVPPFFILALREITGRFELALADPLFVRISGVACAMIWALLFRRLIVRIAADRMKAAALSTLAFSLAGLGVLPFLLVLSRPEQPILLTTTAALLVAVWTQGRRQDPVRSVWIGAAAILLLGMLAASWHMKGILFLPLFLTCLWCLGGGRATRAPRIGAMLLLIGIDASAMSYWVGRFSCPGDPILARRLADQNIAEALAGPGSLGDKIRMALSGANPNDYIALAAAKQLPSSAWLPQYQMSLGAAQFQMIVIMLAWNLALVIALVCLVKLGSARWRERRLDLSLAVPVVALGTVLVWGMSQFHKNDYEASTVLPALLVCIVFPLAAMAWTPLRTGQIRRGVVALAAISLANQIAVALVFLPPLLQVARHPGYIDSQRVSISAYGYGDLRQRVLATARLCRIGQAGRAVHPLVDDLTYFAMMDSWQPFHRLGVLEEWNGTIRDPFAYLKAKGSEGAIVGCRYLRGSLRQRAVQNGEFCCIPTR